jgi:polyphosphate glucokinase
MATTSSAPAIGVDVGGTGIKGAPVDLDAGALAAERIRIPTPQPATPAAVAEVVKEIVTKLGAPDTVGLTLPAVVLDGVVQTAANIDHAWIGTDAAALFREATGRPVGVVNDADAAGIAEVRFGAGRGRSGVVLLLTLGTGIGSALFVNGTLVPNTELGHLHLGKGDAEDWAAESVRERDDLSWKEYASRLQDYLGLVQRLFWPELIVIGGGISKKSEKFLSRIEVEAEVVPALMQNEAGIIGAAMSAPES